MDEFMNNCINYANKQRPIRQYCIAHGWRLWTYLLAFSDYWLGYHPILHLAAYSRTQRGSHCCIVGQSEASQSLMCSDRTEIESTCVLSLNIPSTHSTDKKETCKCSLYVSQYRSVEKRCDFLLWLIIFRSWRVQRCNSKLWGEIRVHKPNKNPKSKDRAWWGN